MFNKGCIVYVRDEDGCIYEGKVIDKTDAIGSYYVGYEMDTAYKETWVSYSRLLGVYAYVCSTSGDLLFGRSKT